LNNSKAHVIRDEGPSNIEQHSVENFVPQIIYIVPKHVLFSFDGGWLVYG